ncbi:hypothetical protein PpBr36_00848 [Pyricularia pennisetigena]|uniref:hypothetical protein n=1 Tax=Pyricularia pennisetigena TaxID=1578925 RepID=UPI00114D9742|nr:hypothetical protein PpBr36_00848 [Pyricularia pennisetigena]TLS28586.1 hypothetical protein PpBr36_00848 [Pyricularia pennisetigena]
MAEHDAFFGSYSHLKTLSRQEDALHTLKRLASMVKPIMRARGWRVRQLAEFYPDQQNLLGLNVNRTHKILVRLRYPGDVNQFLPFEEVTDTLLHELAHIVHGPHDTKFHALWDQLRDEHEGLLRSGYTGDGFLSVGHKLGGRRIPMDEARRIARVAAEKRRAERGDVGRRLGGKAPRPGENIREIIANAAGRRQASLQGCGNAKHDEGEIRQIEEAATRNGFRTKAEEDKANEDAIAQALWELVQEDKKARLGASFVPPKGVNDDLVGTYGTMTDDKSRRAGSDSLKRVGASPDLSDGPPLKRSAASGSMSATVKWTCTACTLINAPGNIRCEICEHPRPNEAGAARFPVLTSKQAKKPEIIDLTTSPKRSAKPFKKTVSDGVNSAARSREKKPAPFWCCRHCDTRMERKWWTCSKCGKMKDAESSQGQAEKPDSGGVYSQEGTYVPQTPRPAQDCWNCLNCKTRMDSRWWICSTCGKMKESS